MIELSYDQAQKCLEAGIWCYLLHWKDHRPFLVVTELWSPQRMGVWYGPMRRGQTKTQRALLEFSRYGIDWHLALPSLPEIGLNDWNFDNDDLAKETMPLLSYRANCFPGCYDRWYDIYYNQLPKVQQEFRPFYLQTYE